MRGKFYMSAEQISADMGRIVRETVGGYRRRGMKTTEAWMHAGNTLGIGWRRVKAYVYGEVRAVPAHEALALALHGNDRPPPVWRTSSPSLKPKSNA